LGDPKGVLFDAGLDMEEFIEIQRIHGPNADDIVNARNSARTSDDDDGGSVHMSQCQNAVDGLSQENMEQ
jgi:hypothetical protein